VGAGFPPGAIDGEFGPGTEAAVLAFQRSSGLLADGIVGARTAAKLGVEPAHLPLPPAMPDITVAMVSKMFPATPLDHIKQNLGPVLQALQDRGLTSAPIVLAALATIRAETASFLPIPEGVSRYNTSPNGRPFDLYDNRKDLGNRGPTDGADFRGRGYIQLTGRANYTHFSADIGLGTRLVERPQDACDPAIAAELLAAFISAQEAPIKEALLQNDLARARRLVNGGSNGLQAFSSAYQTGSGLLSHSMDGVSLGIQKILAA
jgi:peptidoglycan L-alanyl-D-glutamate endopeptidase CwlK